MNRMREITDLPSLAKWFLAAAYATTRRTEVAQTLIDVRNLKTEMTICTITMAAPSGTSR
jgi:hypothetical protein